MKVVVALLGAECTGKSTLTEALGQRLAAWGCATVPEYLRTWCLAQGRTPQQHEQAGIAAEQQRQIAAAQLGHRVVVADTTALMTALYSIHYFQDPSLMAAALAAQRDVALTVLCSPEGIPWQADGWLRDGASTRERTHAELRLLLAAEGIAHTELTGPVAQRVDAVETWVRARLMAA